MQTLRRGLTQTLKASYRYILPGFCMAVSTTTESDRLNSAESNSNLNVNGLIKSASRQTIGDTEPLALSFSGCGFLGTYHFGSVACLRHHAHNTVLSRVEKYAGASAGSLVATVLLLSPDKWKDCLELLYGLADELNALKFGALTSGFSLIRRLEKLIDDALPADAHSLAADRLCVSVTALTDRRNVLATSFGNRPRLIKDCLELLYGLADELNALKFGALTSGFSLIRRLEKLIDDALPADAHSLAADRLCVSVTALTDRRNVLATSFGDRARLIKHLMASCYIPVYAGINEYPPKIDDEEFADGGLTDNLPKFSDVRTITVSPFSGEAEISPSDGRRTGVFDWTMTLSNQIMKVNLKNVVRGAQALFPPNRSVLEQYFDMGYKDTMKFLLKHDLLERDEGTSV